MTTRVIYRRRILRPFLFAPLCVSMLAAAEPARAAAPDDKVKEKLAAVDREVARLREFDPSAHPSAKAYADDLARRAQRVRDEIAGKPDPDATGPELHVVGVYEGSFPDGPRKYGLAMVTLEPIGRPVILTLCAYSPVRWRLRVIDGAKVEKIILAGYGDQLLEDPPAGITVEKHCHKAGNDPNYFYAYRRDGDDSDAYSRAVKLLKELTGLPISTLVGRYHFEGRPLIVGPSNPEWFSQQILSRLEPLYREATALERSRRREALAKLRFHAIKWSPGRRAFGGIGEFAEFTIAGPVADTGRKLPQNINRVAFDPRGPTYYGIEGHSNIAELDLNAGRATALEIEGDIPELSWPCGVAFDTKRNRLILTSFGGVGYMYCYDTTRREWSLLRDMDNVDLQCLTYSAEEDCLYGLGRERAGGGALSIYRFDPSGANGASRELNPRLLQDPGRAILNPPQLVAIPGHLVILTAPALDARGQGEPAPMNCFLVDSKTAQIVYSGEMRDSVLPAANLAPESIKPLWKSLQQVRTADTEETIRKLVAGGDAAVAVIRADLPAADAPDPAKVRDLIDRLSRDQWKDREEATAQLLSIGDRIEPGLRAALASAPSDEVRTRITLVLSELRAIADSPQTPEVIDSRVRDPAVRTRLRAVRVLGQIATPAAVEALRVIAARRPGSIDAEQARAALRKI